MAKLPHVAILVETSRAYGRGLLRGVARYVGEHGPWSIYFRPHGLDDPPPRWLTGWRGDGILVRINDRRMAKAVLETGLPAVDLRNALADVGLPGMGPDNRAVARLALEHLLDRGLRHFGFCGMPRGAYRFMDARCDYFTQLVEQAGYTCSVFQSRGGRRRATTWEQEQDQITGWLAGLPKPVGMMTCNDDRGQQVLDGCLRAGVLVPDDVAVVSVDNDEHLCSLSNPPLTSIDANLQQIGYEAAALLDRLMAGGQPPEEFIEFPPRGIIVRRSTDVLAIDDPDVATTVRFIREHACDPINVQQAISGLPISRSTLERSFKRVLGRTPKAEIVRVQVNRARELLAYSDLSLPTIAAKSGFSTLSHFSQTFLKRVGVSPRAYRNRFMMTGDHKAHKRDMSNIDVSGDVR